MREEKILKEATLGFLIKDKRVWLAMKTDKIGKGCWNGYGGGIEPKDKNIIRSLKREILEECNVQISEQSTEKMAEINFHNTKSNGETFVCKVHVFFIKEWEGEPQRSDEMDTPTSFEINNLPLGKMMPADEEWLPLVLEGKKLIAEYYYGPFQKELNGESKIKIVTNSPEEISREFKITLK
jgi:8-oxo-dGTP pyrophosphatase MutT (NUDIX family)